MPYLNEHAIIGHVGRDAPRVIETQNGDIAEFHVATRKPGRADRTIWHKVRVQNTHLVQRVVPLIKPGALVLVRGESDYETRRGDDGVQHREAIIEIRYEGVIQILERADRPVRSSAAA